MSRRDLQGALDALIRIVDHADTIEAVREGSVLDYARRVALRSGSGETKPVPWTPFEHKPHANLTGQQIALMLKERPEWTEAEAREHFAAVLRTERLMVNSRYQVAVRELGEGGVHLSIKRIDQGPVHDWRDLQRIKDELLGPECEAVELYPAQSRMVDGANQFHLWGHRSPTFRFPFGFMERLVEHAPGHGAAQRAREA